MTIYLSSRDIMRSSIKAITVMLLAVFALAVAGCTDTGNMAVQNGDNVSVDYIGTFEDGKVFDTSLPQVALEAGIYNPQRDYSPLEFQVGGGRIIEGFNKGVIGMKVGETKNITLTPDEGYGQYDPTLVKPYSKGLVNLTKELALYNMTPSVGLMLPTMAGYEVKIVSINESNDTVIIDYNNPMAGKTLLFTVTLRNITRG